MDALFFAAAYILIPLKIGEFVYYRLHFNRPRRTMKKKGVKQ